MARCLGHCRELLAKQEVVDRPRWGWWAWLAWEEWGFPNVRWLLSLITVLHRFLYRASDGLIGARFMGKRFLLLIQEGRRTGLERVTPLLYVDHDDRWVVVASNAGDEQAPAWWLNLKSRPVARIQVGRRRLAVAARRATAEECERLWPKLNGAYRHFEAYQRRTSREIPVVILEPAA
jgi:deazaflavin-dependent oxidoreductase (nitroreductase family)